MEFKLKKHSLKRMMQLMLIMIPFFLPGGLTVITGTEAVSYLFHGMKLFVITFFVFNTKVAFKNNGNKELLGWIILYGLAISTTNLMHGQGVLAFRHVLFFPMFFVICVHYVKKDSLLFFEALAVLTGVYNLIQIVTVVLFYPNGVNHFTGIFWEQTLAGAQYFFGGKNQAIYYMLLFLLSVTIKERLKGSDIPKRIYLYSGIFAVELLFLDSANSIANLMIFMLFYTLLTLKVEAKFSFLFNPYLYLGLGVFIFVSFCVLSMAGTMFFSNVVFKLLGRNSTFTNRIYIWQAAIDAFKTSPLIGAGEIRLQLVGDTAEQAHNMYLDIAYKYGLFGVVPYIALLVFSCMKLDKERRSIFGALCTSLYFIMIIHNCFDAMDNYIFILLICLFSNIQLFYSIHRRKIRVRQMSRRYNQVVIKRVAQGNMVT